MSIAKISWISALSLLAVGAVVSGSVQDKTVQITEKGYVPDRIEILVGQKVVFQNDTQKNHTVTSKTPAGESGQEKDKAAFDSGIILPRTSWEYTFTKEGTYNFYCKEDQSMTGIIVVGAAK